MQSNGLLRRAGLGVALACLAILTTAGCSPSDAVGGGAEDAAAPSQGAGSGSGPSKSADLQLKANPLRGGVQPSADAAAKPGATHPGKIDPALKRRLKSKGSEVPFDPVKENGPIFEGWPKPKLALVISGRQDGYLEPCGCAGLDRMKGGLARRHTMFKQFRADGWPVVGLDVGGLVKTYGRQAELKLQITAEGMRKMGYDAIALGKADLRLPAPELAAVVAGTADKESPFISANAAVFGFDAKLTGLKKVVQAGGLKVGVTAVLGKKAIKEINNPEIETSDPEVALAKVLPELKAQKCDLLVLLAHATLEESEELAKRFPDFHYVVTAGGAPEPPRDEARLIGQRTRLVEVGEKGMHVIVLGFFDAPGGRLQMRYQSVPLDSRFAQSSDMKALMKSYQDQLKVLGWEGVGLKPVPHPRTETQGAFVGSAKCESCHEISYKVWKKSGHSKAYETLVKADPPRNFDAECVACHVIGWDPRQYFPYAGGFRSKEKTPQLADVGCESCHGPGEAHVLAEMKDDEALKEKHRKAVVITKEESEKHFCYECHDLDNSPDFDFKTYWPLVEHYEKE